MKIIVYFIITFIVAGFIDLATYCKNPKRYTTSINKFTIRASNSLVPIGAIELAFGLFIGIGMWIQDGYQYTSWFEYFITIFLCSIGAICMIAPLPRLWDVVVNGNEITIIKLFIFKKKFYISDISFCIVKKGELWVHVRGKEKTAFLVDSMTKGITNFLRRMEKENVPLFEKYKGELFPVKRQGRCFIFIEEQLTQKQREILDNTDAGYFVAKREG